MYVKYGGFRHEWLKRVLIQCLFLLYHPLLQTCLKRQRTRLESNQTNPLATPRGGVPNGQKGTIWNGKNAPKSVETGQQVWKSEILSILRYGMCFY